MSRKKVQARLHSYDLIQDAVETGLRFALNRLEDTTDRCLTDRERELALPRMLDEVMNFLAEVVDFDKSG